MEDAVSSALHGLNSTTQASRPAPNTAVQNDLATRPAHTPGPWRSRLSTNAAKALNVEAGTLGHNIALVNRHGNKNLQEAAANARLIAAAPDMLAALKAVVAHEDRAAADMREMGADVPELPWMPQVKAAIAKAEGR